MPYFAILQGLGTLVVFKPLVFFSRAHTGNVFLGILALFTAVGVEEVEAVNRHIKSLLVALGVSEVTVCTTTDSCVCNGFVSFH